MSIDEIINSKKTYILHDMYKRMGVPCLTIKENEKLNYISIAGVNNLLQKNQRELLWHPQCALMGHPSRHGDIKSSGPSFIFIVRGVPILIIGHSSKIDEEELARWVSCSKDLYILMCHLSFNSLPYDSNVLSRFALLIGMILQVGKSHLWAISICRDIGDPEFLFTTVYTAAYDQVSQTLRIPTSSENDVIPLEQECQKYSNFDHCFDDIFETSNELKRLREQLLQQESEGILDFDEAISLWGFYDERKIQIGVIVPQQSLPQSIFPDWVLTDLLQSLHERFTYDQRLADNLRSVRHELKPLVQKSLTWSQRSLDLLTPSNESSGSSRRQESTISIVRRNIQDLITVSNRMGSNLDMLDLLIMNEHVIDPIVSSAVALSRSNEWIGVSNLVGRIMRSSYREESKRIRCDISTLEKFDIYGNSENFFSILSKLTDNALKYSAVFEEKEKEVVNIDLQKGGDDQLWLDVVNKGPIISSWERDLIFDRLQRGREATKTTARGSGLGLYHAREIAALHSVKVEHLEVGEGREKGWSRHRFRLVFRKGLWRMAVSDRKG